MSLFNRKTKHRVKCSIQIQQLSAVPYSNSFLYCKLRLVSNGKYESRTNKREIKNSCVIWNEPFEFDINMKEEPSPASLQKIMVRISVRQDLPGSKDEVKLGYVDFNLSKFYKTNKDIRSFLHGYEKSSVRCDNSILLISGLIEPIIANGKGLEPVAIIQADNISKEMEVPVPVAKSSSKPTHSRTSSGASGYSSSNNSLNRPEPLRSKGHNRISSLDTGTDTFDEGNLDNAAIVESILGTMRSTSR